MKRGGLGRWENSKHAVRFDDSYEPVADNAPAGHAVFIRTGWMSERDRKLRELQRWWCRALSEENDRHATALKQLRAEFERQMDEILSRESGDAIIEVGERD